MYTSNLVWREDAITEQLRYERMRASWYKKDNDEDEDVEQPDKPETWKIII